MQERSSCTATSRSMSSSVSTKKSLPEGRLFVNCGSPGYRSLFLRVKAASNSQYTRDPAPLFAGHMTLGNEPKAPGGFSAPPIALQLGFEPRLTSSKGSRAAITLPENSAPMLLLSRGCSLASHPGLEPRLTESETVVLPLHQREIRAVYVEPCDNLVARNSGGYLRAKRK